MIEMIGNGMALVDGIVFVVERTGGTDGTDFTDAAKGSAEGESCQQVTSKLNTEIPADVLIRKQRKGCVPDSELTPEQLARRLYMREAKRRSRADVPRKNRRIGERSRAEQIRAAGRAYYQRHREEIMAKRRAKAGAA